MESTCLVLRLYGLDNHLIYSNAIPLMERPPPRPFYVSNSLLKQEVIQVDMLNTISIHIPFHL